MPVEMVNGCSPSSITTKASSAASAITVQDD